MVARRFPAVKSGEPGARAEESHRVSPTSGPSGWHASEHSARGGFRIGGQDDRVYLGRFGPTLLGIKTQRLRPTRVLRTRAARGHQEFRHFGVVVTKPFRRLAPSRLQRNVRPYSV